MSILLEALKKSEQQRQLGQTPNLQTSVEGSLASQVTLNHWIPLSMIALSVGVMGWFGIQQFRGPIPESTPVVPAVVAQTIVEPQPRTMTESFQSNEGSPEDSVSSPPAAPEENEGDKARLNQSFSDFTADNEEAAPTEPISDMAVVDEPPPIPIAELEAIETRPGESKLEPHVSEPISYWELPQTVRDELPEIRISVLVYAERPNKRFLLSNGQRMVEKDELEGGVVLDEIRKDGAVFLYRKYRFLVKA
jgi:general secretion pathway protein B